MSARDVVVAIVALAFGYVLGPSASSAAEPAIDRALVERLVRAVEANAAGTKDLARATERCHK